MSSRVIITQEQDYQDGSTYYARNVIECKDESQARDLFKLLSESCGDIEDVEEGFYGT